ncbi:MAG: Gfo/Idh/MocA family oxidoreductase [Azospirillum sp.]|nr:Gfo/Idh/MocA family oxidoreductase [Azospirillum sp.]
MDKALIDAAIVGCGRIAGGYDNADPQMYPRTHAGAYARRSDVRLVACVDPDADRRTVFARRWGIERQFASLEQLRAADLMVDLVSLCTPDIRHADDLATLAQMPIRAVFAEKPIARDVGVAVDLVDRFATAGRGLAVAYLRRWDPAIRDLAAAIAAGRYGSLRSVNAYYGKGLLHNGSHMVDLLALLVGELRPLTARVRCAGFDASDPSIDAELETRDGAPIWLHATDHHDYDLFEATLVFARGVVELREGAGLVVERMAEATPGYAGHRRPGRGVRWPVRQAEAMERAVANVVDWMRDGVPLACDGSIALAALRLCARIREISK